MKTFLAAVLFACCVPALAAPGPVECAQVVYRWPSDPFAGVVRERVGPPFEVSLAVDEPDRVVIEFAAMRFDLRRRALMFLIDDTLTHFRDGPGFAVIVRATGATFYCAPKGG